METVLNLYLVKEIESTLRNLRKQLNDAVWNQNWQEELRLEREIRRLEYLKERNETHDVAF